MTNVTRIKLRAKLPSQQAPSGQSPSVFIGPPLWSIEETSEYLRIPVNTLYQWRATGSGPKAYKLGKHLRYDPADIRAWLETKVA